MTDNHELNELIAKARERGAVVTVTIDPVAKRDEGRDIIDTVQVSGLKGCGPFPMTALGAAERLRQIV